MKYIDSEKIKDEIKRRKKLHQYNYEKFHDERFVIDECEDDQILSFIDTLEQETKRDPHTEEKWKVFCEKCIEEGIEPPTYETFSKRK